jgi:hypothetical protein
MKTLWVHKDNKTHKCDNSCEHLHKLESDLRNTIIKEDNAVHLDYKEDL